MMPFPRPHDLLQFDSLAAGLVLEVPIPEALEPLRSAPYGVVRRARRRDGLLPVGIRGPAREQRFAAWLDPAAILCVHRPETLRSVAGTRDLPVFAALALLQQAWDDRLGLPWGPVGSVGFELASGVPAASAISDLDLLIRVAERCAPEQLNAIAHAVDTLPCAVDVQIEAPAGAFSLKEYLAAHDGLLLRTPDGPRLVTDPWHPDLKQPEPWLRIDISSTVLA